MTEQCLDVACMPFIAANPNFRFDVEGVLSGRSEVHHAHAFVPLCPPNTSGYSSAPAEQFKDKPTEMVRAWKQVYAEKAKGRKAKLLINLARYVAAKAAIRGSLGTIPATNELVQVLLEAATLGLDDGFGEEAE